jgi:predicted deacylase
MLGWLLLPLAALPQEDAPNGDYGGFWTWPEMTARIEAFEKAHPGLLHRTSLGKTVEGRDIVLLKVSDRAADDEDEPELLLMAGIHPREQQPQIAIMDLLEQLLERYGKDDRITRLVDGRETWIIPVFNVDGKVHDMRHGNGKDKGANWRKNRRKNEDGTFGVDLNRNFPVRWGGAPDEGDSITFEGPQPLSEPETQALARFFETRPLRAFVDVHSTMRALLHPAYMIPADAERYGHLTRGMRAAQKDPYRATEPIADVDPPPRRQGNTGLSNAWGFYARGVTSIIFEIGGAGFYAKPEEIRREVAANVRGALLHVIEAAAELPLPKEGSATLKSGKTARPLVPGAETAWTPVVEGKCDYAVLVSETAAVQVPSEFRRVPVMEGFTVQVPKSAKPGTKAPMTLYLWDAERGRSAARFELAIEAP